VNLPANPQGNQLPSDPSQMADYYARYAQAYVETEPVRGASIKIQNGMMMVGDQVIPGNQFAAIILDAAHLNTFHVQAYNPNVIAPPTCYAIGRTEMEMAPHPDMAKDLDWFKPQAERCNGCPQNEFGTARQGAGKACGNRRRLLLLVAGTYQGQQLMPITDLSAYETGPLLTMTVAPTSSQGWGKFIRDASAQYQRPPFGVITRVYLYAHPKHGKEAIGFEIIAPLPDDWAPTIFRRQQEAQTEVMAGYEPPQRQEQQQAPQRGGGFYGAQQGGQAWQSGPGAPGFGNNQGGGFR
jgi:hypothetical protein